MKLKATQTTASTRLLYLSITLLIVIAFAATTLRMMKQSEVALPTGDSAWSKGRTIGGSTSFLDRDCGNGFSVHTAAVSLGHLSGRLP